METPHSPDKLCQINHCFSSYLPQSPQRRIPAPVPPSLSESRHSAAEAPRSGYPAKSQRWGGFGVAGLWHSSGPCPCLSSMWLCWFCKERKTNEEHLEAMCPSKTEASTWASCLHSSQALASHCADGAGGNCDLHLFTHTQTRLSSLRWLVSWILSQQSPTVHSPFHRSSMSDRHKQISLQHH